MSPVNIILTKDWACVEESEVVRDETSDMRSLCVDVSVCCVVDVVRKRGQLRLSRPRASLPFAPRLRSLPSVVWSRASVVPR